MAMIYVTNESTGSKSHVSLWFVPDCHAGFLLPCMTRGQGYFSVQQSHSRHAGPGPGLDVCVWRASVSRVKLVISDSYPKNKGD